MSIPEDEGLLALLDYCGLKVDADGTLSDWQDRPAREAHPIMPATGQKSVRNHFTPEDDRVLTQWCAAAQADGILGPQIFEQLEVLRPKHTWQAYENRWRKKLKHLPIPKISTDDPYPNLDKIEPTITTSGEAESSQILSPIDEDGGFAREIQPSDFLVGHEGVHGDLPGVPPVSDQLGEQEGRPGYNDHRVDIDHVLLSNLGLNDEEELRQLLKQSWVQIVYAELLAMTTSGNLSLTQIKTRDGSLQSRSQHLWKTSRATQYLSTPSQAPPRYTAEAPDTASWTEDDFDVRFLIRAVTLGSAAGQVWCQERKDQGSQGLCDKALHLLLWFKWLHKTTRGKGKEMRRLQEKREAWLEFMHTIEMGQSTVASLRRHHTKESEAGPPSIPIGRTRDPQRQLYLLSDDARNLFLRNRDLVLGSWGIGTQHDSTCLLVPAAWSSTDPVSLVDCPEAWYTEAENQKRMTLSIAPFNHHWARWAAWFQEWPRGTSDLERFLPQADDASRMHGSHICHHGLCVLPSHIMYEDISVNLGRSSCAYKARVLRQFGASIPQYCRNVLHQPRCLLQLAAITDFEAFATQFNVLRIIRNLPASTPLPRPSHHPSDYETFFQGPGPSVEFPTVGVVLKNLVRLPHIEPTQRQRGFSWNCIFCSYHRSFRKITSFWAHLSVGHEEIPRSDVVREVTRSAQANQAWADRNFYDYQRNNPVTWQKIQQALAPDFEWEVFSGWKLSRKTLYKGKVGIDDTREDEARSENPGQADEATL